MSAASPADSDDTVDWTLVDPCAETSLRMALALGANLEREGDVLAKLGPVTYDNVDFDDAEGAAVAAAGEDEEEGGMGETAGSMMEYFTSEEEPWTVVRITKRRRVKVQAQATDLIDEEHSVTDLEYEYLCEWENTRTKVRQWSWESRGWLLDAGFGLFVTAQDERLLPARPRHSDAIPFASVHSFAERLRARMPPELVFALKNVATGGPFVDPPSGVPIDHITYFARRLLQEFQTLSVFVESVAFITPENFHGVLEKARGGARLVFHGTSSHCCSGPNGIVARGLRVPGTLPGAVMRHGSAFGVGIYAAYEMRVSEGYSTDVILVCLSVARPVTTTPNFGVFASHEDVCPFIRLQVRPAEVGLRKKTTPSNIAIFRD